MNENESADDLYGCVITHGYTTAELQSAIDEYYKLQNEANEKISDAWCNW